MVRHYRNEHELRSAVTSAHVRALEDLVGERKEEMQRKWADVDLGWENLFEKMSKAGISMSSSTNHGTVPLNVGGSDLYIPWSVLERTEFASGTWPLGDLFGSGMWRDDKRLPVSAGGRVVLDESPVCVERIINEVSSQGSGTVGASQDLLAAKDFPADELAYFSHVADVLGLSTKFGPKGGSAVLEAEEKRTLTDTILDWCPDKPGGLELLYRASRDGWTAEAFHDKCDGFASTITLARVNRQGSETTDSVVGGFSSVPWASSGDWHNSPGAFLFVLKDGVGNGQPMRWGVNDGHVDQAVYLRGSHGPSFGNWAFAVVNWNEASTCLTMRTGGYYDNCYNVSKLDGRTLQDLEVFRVCPHAHRGTPPTSPPCEIRKEFLDCTSFSGGDAMSAEEYENDVRRFGVAIAESLKEERVALHHAGIELVQANEKAAAFENALLALYGKQVASGQEDPVVELSIRGTFTTKRFTTLLSTIQACPESALAARFKENGKWKLDKDAYGRELIKDCSPAVFSKVLDVLRMRKREGWCGIDGTKKRDSTAVRVAVKSSDREAFEAFVNMQFPGCEGFIMDCVSFLNPNGNTKGGGKE